MWPSNWALLAIAFTEQWLREVDDLGRYPELFKFLDELRLQLEKQCPGTKLAFARADLLVFSHLLALAHRGVANGVITEAELQEIIHSCDERSTVAPVPLPNDSPAPLALPNNKKVTAPRTKHVPAPHAAYGNVDDLQK